jgi:hypothetical protein
MLHEETEEWGGGIEIFFCFISRGDRLRGSQLLPRLTSLARRAGMASDELKPCYARLSGMQWLTGWASDSGFRIETRQADTEGYE